MVDPSAVIAAVVVAIPPTLMWYSTHRKTASIDRVVQGNGHGAVDVMLATLIEEVAEAKKVMTQHVTDQKVHHKESGNDG